MEILLEEFYKQDLHNPYYVERKTQLHEEHSQIIGVSQSGKSSLIKHYLLQQKKSTYLYIDCSDIRIDVDALNSHLQIFCLEHSIEILALDNYNPAIVLPAVQQILISGEQLFTLEGFELIRLYPLDFEEFLAYEHKFDSTALNHYLQLGGFPAMHRTPSEDRIPTLQRTLQHALSDIEFSLIWLITKMASQKVSAFALYERLKSERRISKDMLYKSMEQLIDKGYVHQVEKFSHTRATKKLYLCDIAIKHALTTQKHFGRLFENLIFLELLKHDHSIYYAESIDFYLPTENRAILCMPFSNKEMLFKKIEGIEGFLVTHQVSRVEVVTMSSEGELHHPFADVEMMPFAIWALQE
ncbi:MAG: ATP-binding protein [Campylobacterota bacterium]|nr:ATP-binding protein [Campylobacterota bacterium]